MQALFKVGFDLIPWWLWPLALFAAIAVGVTAYEIGRADLAQAREALADLQREQAKATTRASEAAREKETMLLTATVVMSEKLNEEKRRAQDTQNRLVADILAGTQRLSIAANCPAGQAGADPSSTPTSWAKGARAELDPEAAEALVAIAADGDQAIRERNACIEQYNAVREALN